MSRRDEIKADEKVRIAKAYTQGKIGISEAAKQIGVHHTVIKDWMPNEKWLTDVTEFKWYEGPVVHKVYLSAMGAFGGLLVGKDDYVFVLFRLALLLFILPGLFQLMEANNILVVQHYDGFIGQLVQCPPVRALPVCSVSEHRLLTARSGLILHMPFCFLL